MQAVVGTRGQVVITKSVRDELGIGPGWTAIQHVRNNKLEMTFQPPQHKRSLRGILAKHAKAEGAVSEETLREVSEAALRDAAVARFKRAK